MESPAYKIILDYSDIYYKNKKQNFDITNRWLQKKPVSLIRSLGNNTE